MWKHKLSNIRYYYWKSVEKEEQLESSLKQDFESLIANDPVVIL